MSEHFYTFQGVDATAGPRVADVSGIVPGDKIIDLVAVEGGTGSFVNYYGPFAPQGSALLQLGSDLSAYRFLVRIQRAD